MVEGPLDQGRASSAGRILVVDDEETIRDSLVDIVRDNGYEAVGATDGRDALTKLRGAPGRWGLIILDLTMPVMDGRAFREEQRRDPAIAAIPVIVLSAYRDVAKRVADLDITHCLAKPIDLALLVELVGVLTRPAPTR